jgi:hypothetical protein
MQAIKIRYGDVVNSLQGESCAVSYNQLTPRPRYGALGQEIPYQPPRVRLNLAQVLHLLRPYTWTRLREQLWALLPLAFYLLGFTAFILHSNIKHPLIVASGLLAAMLGLMLFMEGLKHGLMPFGESIGNLLPRKLHLFNVLLLIFILGIGVTLAEPAIGALKTSGSMVSAKQSPYLYLLLNQWSGWLALAVGIGVGLAAMLACLRILFNWSLKPLIYLSLVPTLGLSFYFWQQPALRGVVGLAWDCGAVTTGPVTVPLVLALGIGIASSAGKGQSPLSGFGTVTLASLLPVLTVLLLGLFAFYAVPAKTIQAGVSVAALWHESPPIAEFINSLRAIVPLLGFLLLVMLIVLREKIAKPGILLYGIILLIAGMILFNLGLTYGLSNLGEQAGNILPGAFEKIRQVEKSPLYSVEVGILVVCLFSLFLGFVATLAEPALQATGITVQNLTQGALKKKSLVYAVSFGVAGGMAVGVMQMIFAWPLLWLLAGGYGVAAILTWFSREDFVNIAWDSAGVTTGPITVPLVLALGLGLGGALQRPEGFGILAMASIGPIVSVLSVGLWIDWQVRRSHQIQ